jgi:hypothetical protein
VWRAEKVQFEALVVMKATTNIAIYLTFGKKVTMTQGVTDV